MEKKSLYERLGGDKVLEQVSHKIGEKLLNDSSSSQMFKNVDIKKTNENRKDYLARLFGGPNEYKGKSLSEAHKPLNLQEGHFNMFLFYFKQILSEMKVDSSLIEEASRVLETTRGEVLSQKSIFERLGGDDIMNKLGDLLGKKILADNLLGPIYSKTDFKKVNEMRMQYIKSLFGGKSEYQGRSMKEAHSKHELNDSHFDRFIYLFKDSLAELGVKNDMIKDAINLLESTRYQILNRPSLFETIGGFDALERIVANFQNKFKEEPSLAHFLKDKDPSKMKELREGVKRYYASILGGPNSYTGRSLKEAHSDLKINDQHFNTYLKLIRKAFLEEGVKEDITNQFLEALDIARDQVLGRKSIMERLGGHNALLSIMKAFHENLRKDKLLGPIYEKGDPERMIKNYTHYFAYMFGESEPHVDQSLGFVHGHMKLTDIHFDLFIEIFARTLVNFKVSEELVNEIRDELEKRRNDVLQRKSLWERLGGEEFMNKVCHKFEEILMKDPVVGPMHKSIDIQKYHENHMDLFADLFGGYHFYSGKSMKEAHRPLKLNDDHFDLFVKLFQQALKDNGVKNELLEEVREKMEFERNEVLNRRSLYEKMGGEPAVDLLVEKLHSLIANDPEIGPFHKNVDWAKLQLHRKQFFIQLFGNLNVYQGKDLRTAHSEFKLNDKHFDIFMKLFNSALSQAGIKEELTDQIMNMLEGTRREVLNNPSIYEKVGGQEGIMKFVVRLDDVSVKDPTLSKFFEKIDRKKLDEHQFQYFSNMFGGPKVNYEGKSVRTAHEHLPLSDEHFKIYLERTQEVLKEMNVDKQVVEEAVRLFQNKRSEVLNQ